MMIGRQVKIASRGATGEIVAEREDGSALISYVSVENGANYVDWFRPGEFEPLGDEHAGEAQQEAGAGEQSGAAEGEAERAEPDNAYA